MRIRHGLGILAAGSFEGVPHDLSGLSSFL